MKRKDYVYMLQDAMFEKYKENDFIKDINPIIKSLYSDVDCKVRRPDLLGKTVKVSPSQFSDIYYMAVDISDVLGIEIPDMFVFEDFYYGMESFGVEKYWIEISAKTLRDLEKNEIRFLLARELFKISDEVTKEYTIINEQIKILPKQFKEIARMRFNQWYRVANFSADNFGYLMCASVSDCVYAMLKLVLNSTTLVKEVNIREFIAQASEISELSDAVYDNTKADEVIPYAPYRMKNLLSYAVSERAFKALS